MPDNLNRRRPQDASKINIHEPYEVSYWTETLGVSAVVLRKAVSAVGIRVQDVKQWLRTNKHI